jgi:RimJ/RimL family protein N-acetyltransferase
MLENLAEGAFVNIRKITVDDLEAVSQFAYSVSIVEPLTDFDNLREAHQRTDFWQPEGAAVAIVENETGRMVGTTQFYRSAPCIHGFELGYIIHNEADRGKGFPSEAVRLFSDYLFSHLPDHYRQQLLIEVWNTASWKVAERSGFVREGVLRSCGFGDGDPADCFVYSRTRKDFAQQKTSANGA